MKPSDRHYYYGAPGSKIFVQEWGDLDKPVVLLVHGFPGCADHGKFLTTSKLWGSIRLIAMDRPGYGHSDPQRFLGPMGFARQIKSMLDEKGIEQISILSVSGATPYSMALATLLGDRVKHLTSVAGVAPLTVQNFKYLSPVQRKTWFTRTVVPDRLLMLALDRVWKSGTEKLDRLMFNDLDSYPEMDRKVFEDPLYGPVLLETTRHALKGGPRGILDDMRVYAKPWGFSFADIRCPVTLWHGTNDDIVNVRYAQDMQRYLPQARVKFIEREGHYSLFLNCRDQILSDLLAY